MPLMGNMGSVATTGGRRKMARTPLLRALRQLASEHAEASMRGIPVEEVRRLRLAAISRRDYPKGLAQSLLASRFLERWPGEDL